MLITYQAKLLKKIKLTHDVYLFTFSFPENSDWTFKAGQYMIMHIPQTDGHPARRLYSIASAPHETHALDFVIQIVPNGVAGPFLLNMQENEQLTMQGPAGLFTFKNSPAEVVFLATGTGVAPMYSIIKSELEIQKNTNPFTLFWGLKKCEDMYLFDELKQLAQTYPNFTLKLCFSREDLCEGKFAQEDLQYATIGRITANLEQIWQKESLQELKTIHYYICGSKEIVESLRSYLEEKGIEKERVHFEKFT